MVQKQWYTFGNWPCDQIKCSNYDEFVRCNEQKTQEQSFEEMMSRSKKNGGSRWLEWWVFLVIITKLLLNFTQCCTQWLLPLLLLLSHFIVFYNIRVCVSCTGLRSNNFYNNLRGNKSEVFDYSTTSDVTIYFSTQPQLASFSSVKSMDGLEGWNKQKNLPV